MKKQQGKHLLTSPDSPISFFMAWTFYHGELSIVHSGKKSYSQTRMLEGLCRDGGKTKKKWSNEEQKESQKPWILCKASFTIQNSQNSGPIPFSSPTWWEEWSLEIRNDLDQFSNHLISSQTLAFEASVSCLCECDAFLNGTDMGLALRWKCLSLPSVYYPSLTATATASHWQTPHNSNDLSSVVHHLYSQDV